MASVKIRPNSPFYVACFRLPNGKRKQVSTHTTDKKEAQQIALSYEKAASLAEARALNETTARAVVQEIAALAGYKMAQGRITVAEHFNAIIAAPAPNLRERTVERYGYALRHFRDGSGLADRQLFEVQRTHALAWRDSLIAEGLSPSSVNSQLGTVRLAFAQAIESGYIDRNPFDGVRVKGARRMAQRREAFTFEQFSSLVNALGLADCPVEHAHEWRLLVLLAGYTGQRRGDLVALKADAVNLQRGVIGFWRSKNADRHEVPIHPALHRELAKRLAEVPAGAPLFPELTKLRTRGRESISDQFRQTVLPIIGIVQPYQHSSGQRKRVLAPLSFHSLRHSLSSWLNAAGVSDVDRMKVVGHADKAVSFGYTHAGLENAKRAIALVPEVTLPDGAQATPPARRPAQDGNPSCQHVPAA